MSKAVDLTGLSRAITNLEEWVLGQRTHYGVEKSFGAEAIRTLSGQLSFEGYANYASIDISLMGLETTIKLNRGDQKTISYIESYNNYNVDLHLDWKDDYSQYGYTDISWEIRVEDNFPLYVDGWETINIVVPQKLLPEIYIPDTIAREDESMRILRYIANPHIINMSGSASERAIPKELYDAETDSFKMFGFSHDYPFVMIDHYGTVCPIYFDREGEQYIPRIWTVSGGASLIEISNGIVINIDLSH